MSESEVPAVINELVLARLGAEAGRVGQKQCAGCQQEESSGGIHVSGEFVNESGLYARYE